MGFVSGFCFCVPFVRGLIMSISAETHVLMINCVAVEFQAQKLLHHVWGYDYLLFEGDRHAYYYDSKTNELAGVDGITITSCRNYIKLKPQDKPWTAKDAVEYLDHPLYNGAGAYLGGIIRISSHNVEINHSTYTYGELMRGKMTVLSKDGYIPAYHPGV